MRRILFHIYKVLPAPLREIADGLRAVVNRRVVRTIESGVGRGLKIHADRARQYVSGANELPVQEAFARHLEPGQVFYDIGANVGFFTLIGAKLVGPSGKVFSFEPVPQNARAVRRNAELNGYANVQVFQKAVSRSAGEGRLVLSRHPGGGALSSGDVMPPDAVGTVSVDLISIDDLVAAGAIPYPAVVKIDVEGAELEVLEGMEQTIRTHRPVLIYEVDDSDERAFVERRDRVDAFVRGLGYDIERLRDAYPGNVTRVGHAVALPL